MTAHRSSSSSSSSGSAIAVIAIAIGIIMQATSALAQYSSYAVSRDAVYYTKTDGDTIFFKRTADGKETQIVGTLHSVNLYGPGPRLAGTGTGRDFYLYGDSSETLPPSAPNNFQKWKGQQGSQIVKSSGSPNASPPQLWGITSSNVLFQWKDSSGIYNLADLGETVTDLHVRDLVYIVMKGNQVCSRNFNLDKVQVCVTPSFPAKLIAAGDSFLYVLSATGPLMATKKPLTPNSVFYDTGFSAPGATLLSMPVDYDNVYILDALGTPNESICSTPNVNCFPDGSTPKPETPTQQSTESTTTSSISSTTITTTETLSQTSSQVLTATSTDIGVTKSPNSQDGSSPQGLSTGILAGIIVGAIVIVILVVLVIFLLRRRASDSHTDKISPIASAGVQPSFFKSGGNQQFDIKPYGGQSDEYPMATMSSASYGQTNLQNGVVDQTQIYGHPAGTSEKIGIFKESQNLYAGSYTQQQQQQQYPQQQYQQQHPQFQQQQYQQQYPTNQMQPVAPPRAAHPYDQPVQVTMTEKGSYVPSQGSVSGMGSGSNQIEDAPPMYEGAVGSQGVYNSPAWDQKRS
ncbi:hypothetical protein HDU97_004504 [Phlyctochytrium planicorne]|nr:hypothetical protein HDU97_004504 [Phlyctochytrium planicorne]